jgi:hypothetical protein
VAVDSEGFVYTTGCCSDGPPFIWKFTSEGERVQFGNCTTTCFPGTWDYRIYGITIVGNFLYLSYYDRARDYDCDPTTGVNCIIQKATLNGTFVTAFGSDTQYNGPQGIAVDSAGYVYLSDTSNHRILKADPSDGTVLAIFGSRGQADGKFDYPTGLFRDGQGRFFVADSANDRVQVFDADWNPQSSTGKSTLYAYGWSTAAPSLGIYAADKGDVYAADYRPDGQPRVSRFDSSGRLLFRRYLNEYLHLVYPPYPTAIVVNQANGTIYVASICASIYCDHGARITALGPDGTLIAETYSLPFEPYCLSPCNAIGLAIDEAGVIYAISSARYAISTLRKFDAGLKLIESFETDSQFRGIAVDSKGLIYLSYIDIYAFGYYQCNYPSLYRCWVSVYNNTGTLLSQLNGVGGWYLAMDSSDSVYVSNYQLNAITKYDWTRNWIFNWTLSGIQSTPLGVSIDKSGLVYLAGRDGTSTTSGVPAASIVVYPQSTPDSFPSVGGDTGSVTTFISTGSMPSNGTLVKLVQTGQPDITGSPAVVSEDGTRLITTFNLTGQPRGAWDIVVIGPSGESQTFPGGFTVEPGRPPSLWISLVGPSVVRVGAEATYTVFLGNDGNINAEGVPLWILGRPQSSEWSLKFNPIILPLPNPDGGTIDLSTLPTTTDTPNGVFVPLIIPEIPPGAPLEIQFTVKENSPVPFQYEAVLNPPVFCPQDSGNNGIAQAWLKCAVELLKFAFKTAYNFLLPATCIDRTIDGIRNTATTLHDLWVKGFRGKLGAVLLALPVTVLHMLWPAAVCALSFLKRLFPALTALQVAVKIAQKLKTTYSSWAEGTLKITECDAAVSFEAKAALYGQRATSMDPNDKVGPAGIGVGRYISGYTPFEYVVLFENLANATAPAVEVLITDLLDPTTMDLNTLSLGPIAFGDKEVLPPPGTHVFNTNVDLRPENNLIVNINVRLDASNALTWHFKAVDPNTGTTPTDPSAGFLPPNVNSPEGQGYVTFTMRPKTGLASGTVIRNRATIVFDINPPISTPEWINTIDSDRPVSQILADSLQYSTNFQVQWSGSDQDSGILDYTVFFSEDGSPFTPWLQNTEATSETFRGEPGRTYSFYSIARDRAGNLEDAPNVPDSTVQVAVDATSPASDVVLSGVGILATVGYPGSAAQPIAIYVILNNLGSSNETFTVTVKANETIVEVQTVTVAAHNSIIIIFNWNIQTITAGLYNITAETSPIEGDNPADNVLSGGFFRIRRLGDVDGDGDVDLNDLVLVWLHQFTSFPGVYDIDNDGDDDINDLIATWAHQFT